MKEAGKTKRNVIETKLVNEDYIEKYKKNTL